MAQCGILLNCTVPIDRPIVLGQWKGLASYCGDESSIQTDGFNQARPKCGVAKLPTYTSITTTVDECGP